MCEMMKLGDLLWMDSKDIWNGYLEGFKAVSLWIDCEGEGGGVRGGGRDWGWFPDDSSALHLLCA